MSNVPGPKTSPTVNSQARVGRSWEVKLGLFQLVILLGVITGSMVCTFFVGFFSGKQIGYQTALAASQANAVKLPIELAKEDEKPGSTELASEVYAKLHEKSAHKEGAEEAMPNLGAIKTTDAAPIGESLGEEDAGEEGSAAEGEAEHAAVSERSGVPVHEETAEDVDIGGLNDSKGTDDAHESKTLKEVINEQEESGRADADSHGSVLPEVAHDEPSKAVEKKDLHSLKGDAVSVPAVSAQHNEAVGRADSEPVEETAPPTREKEKEKEKTPPSTLKRGWFAQVAAPKKKSDADALTSKLKASGFPVSIETAEVRGENYYRVMVGPEENRDQADRLLLQLKRESYLKSSPFLRMVK